MPIEPEKALDIALAIIPSHFGPFRYCCRWVLLVARGYSGRMDGRWLLPLIVGEHVLPKFQPLQTTTLESFPHNSSLVIVFTLINFPNWKSLSTLYVPNQPRQRHESIRGKMSNPPGEHQERSKSGSANSYPHSEQREHTRSFTECKLPHPSSYQIRTGPKR